MNGKPGQLKVIRIFICSAGDMLPERVLAESIIQKLAAICRDQANVEAYRWENNVSNFRTDYAWQRNIPLPADFDIFLAFIHARIGTKLTPDAYRQLLALAINQKAEQPGLEGELPTGTQFEIENAFAASDSHDDTGQPRGKPVVWLAWNKASLDKDPKLSPEELRERSEQKNAADTFCRQLNQSARPRILAQYGEGELRSYQTRPGGAGLSTFQEQLESWLRKTLTERFSLDLAWDREAYVGLRPFDESEAPIFFGRRSEIDNSFEKFEKAVNEGRPPMLLLSGRSGVGKSSFARAGLVAGLGHRYLHIRREADRGIYVQEIRAWTRLILQPSQFVRLSDGSITELLKLLAGALGNEAQFGNELPVSKLAEPIAEHLTSNEQPDISWFSDVTKAVHRLLAQRSETAALFVLLDQMEDLLDPGVSPGVRLLAPALLRALAGGAKGNVWICLVLNEAWRDQLDPAGSIPFLKGSEQLELSSLRSEEIYRIVEGPAERKRLQFEQNSLEGNLAGRIEDDLRELSLYLDAPLALLQVALHSLEGRARNNVLTFEAYESIGGLKGAIQAHSERVLAGINERLRNTALDPLFFKLLESNPRGEIVTRAAPMQELKAQSDVWQLAQELWAPEARLLIIENEDRATAVVRIAHDVLREHFPQLKSFISRERHNLIELDNAKRDAEQWCLAGKPLDGLLRGRKPIDTLLVVLDRARIPHEDILREFVRRSNAWLLASEAAEKFQQGNCAGALKLIGRGAALDFKGQRGETLLHIAAAWGLAEGVSYLLECNPALAEARDDSGGTALHCAASEGDPEVVKLLLERAPALAKARNEDGWTALHCAAARGELEAVQLLLGEVQGLADVTDDDGRTALHEAAIRGHPEVMKLLLERAPAVANTSDKDGRTALHFAAAQGHVEVVRLLVERTPALAEALDRFGKTALDLAKEYERTDVARLLLTLGQRK